MNKLIETKLRRLVQKEIKSMLKENENETPEDIFNRVDFKPLTKEISKRIGTSVELQYTFEGKDRVNITSENLIKKAGIFKSVISEVYVTDFGSKIFTDYEDHGTLLTITVNLSYPGNGMNILTAWCKKDNTWSFRGEPRSGM